MSDTRSIIGHMVDAEVQCRPTIASCGHRTRFVVLAQGACFLAILMASIVCWNPAMIVLIDVTSSPIYDPSRNQTAEEFNNPELSLADRRIPFSTVEKSTLFAGIFIGALAGVLPLNWLLQKIGTHKTMIGVGIVSVVTTALTPIAAVTDFKVLLVVRIIQGTTLSNPFPVIGSITNSWSSLKESGLFVSLLTGYIQISAVFAMLVSGAVASNVSWPMVFYIHALVGAILCAVWGYNFRDEPYRHPFVSDKEFRKISMGKVRAVTKQIVPYRAIFTDIHIWVLWLATSANFLVAQFAITYMPMYFVYVCKLPISVASSVSAIPLVMQFFAKFLSGVITDRLTFISEMNKCRIFNTLAFWGTGIMFIVTGLVPSENSALSVTLIVISISLLGFNAGGYTKSVVLVSKQFSPTVMAVMQVILCLSLFTGSYLVPALTPDGTHEQYALVFYIYAAYLIVANLVFCILGSGNAAPWTVAPLEPVQEPDSLNTPPTTRTASNGNLPASIPVMPANGTKIVDETQLADV